jgi:osomolarity two-component system sensor histidine kinase NIK1
MTYVEMQSVLSKYISNLAKKRGPTRDISFSGQIVMDSAGTNGIVLPGPDTSDKASLERELGALAARIQYLEAKANVVGNHTFPMTPGELANSPFLYAPAIAPVARNSDALERRDSHTNQTTNCDSIWLADRGSNGDQTPMAALTEERPNYLCDHGDNHADHIKDQSKNIDNLSAKVNKQPNNQSLPFEHGIEYIDALKRELGKHQQANLAFQRALREIGDIVTAVAMGDLSKKVLIHAKEMDPEITNFKSTINKMVDQLQEFASQVTHLAKEVGTEGRLGGQANVPGVDGIWAELTDSGMT